MERNKTFLMGLGVTSRKETVINTLNSDAINRVHNPMKLQTSKCQNM